MKYVQIGNVKKIPIIIVQYIQYENYLILLMVLKASSFST